MIEPATVKCSQCGKEHPRESVELAFKRPDFIHAMPADQRKAEAKESDDQCMTKDGRYFLRGLIPLKVASRDRPYCIGAWVEVDRSTYDRVSDLWGDANQANEPLLPAVLANRLPLLPDTLGLAVKLQLTGPKTRPDIFIPPSTHPLHNEQCQGISEHRAHDYSTRF
jgi:hypothetical protein